MKLFIRDFKSIFLIIDLIKHYKVFGFSLKYLYFVLKELLQNMSQSDWLVRVGDCESSRL